MAMLNNQRVIQNAWMLNTYDSYDIDFSRCQHCILKSQAALEMAAGNGGDVGPKNRPWWGLSVSKIVWFMMIFVNGNAPRSIKETSSFFPVLTMNV